MNPDECGFDEEVDQPKIFILRGRREATRGPIPGGPARRVELLGMECAGLEQLFLREAGSLVFIFTADSGTRAARSCPGASSS